MTIKAVEIGGLYRWDQTVAPYADHFWTIPKGVLFTVLELDAQPRRNDDNLIYYNLKVATSEGNVLQFADRSLWLLENMEEVK